ncbi:hypothetical protein FGSG_13637, partial [Fusarium graminearum PH-1]
MHSSLAEPLSPLVKCHIRRPYVEVNYRSISRSTAGPTSRHLPPT